MTSPRRLLARRWLPLAALGAAIVLVALLIGAPGEGLPLDPTSTGPAGTKALVDVLDELGVDVAVTDMVDERDTVALILADNLDEETRTSLTDWAESGGLLVVADPASPLSPEVAGTASIGPLQTSLPRRCDLPALAHVDRVAAPGSAVYATDSGGASGTVACFPRGEGHWLVGTPTGEGAVVALGGPGAFTNAALDDADNVLLAAALLAPADGGVVVLRPPAPGAGDATLADLVADRVWFALAQLAVAFALVVAWRARRLGTPLSESQPVQIAGSELVTAVGNLLQHTGSRAQAARLLRAALRRELAERLGLPADSSSEVLAQAAARRSGRSSDDLGRLLAGTDPPDDAALAALAAELERAREAALAVASPTKERTRVS